MIPFERDPRRGPGREPNARGNQGSGRGAVDRRALAVEETPELERDPGVAGWLIGPLCLCAVATAMLFIFRGPDRVFGIAFGLVLALGLSWILVSALFPARADRRCPRCGRATVVRANAAELTGLRCTACTWRDESASAFIHAEDEGAPLEDIVLRARGRRRRP